VILVLTLFVVKIDYAKNPHKCEDFIFFVPSTSITRFVIQINFAYSVQTVVKVIS